MKTIIKNRTLSFDDIFIDRRPSKYIYTLANHRYLLQWHYLINSVENKILRRRKI